MQHKILIVDDDPHVVAGLRRALHKESFDVTTAGSAQDALEILAIQRVHVVISDEHMPGMSGTVFLRKVCADYPDTVRFILTGKGTLDTAIQAINEGGISRFFVKPCNLFDLVLSIRQELQKRELMVAARRLLRKVESQSVLIQSLEQQFPNITRVERDDDGAILVDEDPGDYEDLMDQICRQVR